MNKNIIKEDLVQLFDHEAPVSISIYLPMAESGEDTLKNPIRFKNALKELEQKMQQSGIEKREIRETIEKLNEIVNGYAYFQDQLEGLAIFLAGDFHQIIKVPMRFEQQVVVSNAFEVRPLLHAMQNDREFYIIAMSQEGAKLFKANKLQISEVELSSDTPTSFSEAMRYDDPENRLHHQTISQVSGDRNPIFHGHTEKDQKSKNIRRFFQLFDRGVKKAITRQELPILLAGLDYYHPIYRDVTELSNILGNGVETGLNDISVPDLHQAAWDIVKEEVGSPAALANKTYKNLLATEKTSDNLTQLSLAATYGRIDTLIADKTKQVWGQVNPEEDKVIIKDNGDAGEEDIELLGYSIKQTLRNGGEVFVMEEEMLPSEESPLAGIMRY